MNGPFAIRWEASSPDPSPLALAAQEMGAVTAAQGAPFDLLVVDEARFASLAPPDPAAGPGPAVVVWAASLPSDPRPFLGRGVEGILTPSHPPGEARRVLALAAEEGRRRREDAAARRETELRYRDLSTLVRLNLEVGTELDVDRVLDRIVGQIGDDLGFGIVSLMLVGEDGQAMAIRASRGLSPEIAERARVEVGKGVSGWVAQTGQPLLVKDIESHPQFQKIRSHGRYSSKSLICVPLKVQDRVIGVLNGNNRRDGAPLNVHDLRLLSAFAAQASLTIERARLYRQAESRARELVEANARLQEMDRMKSDFITNVSHEFRTPLTIVLGYLEILKGRVTEPSCTKMLDITLKEAQGLVAVMEDITDMLRLDTSAVAFEFLPLQVGDLLARAVRNHQRRFAEKRVQLTLNVPSGLPLVRADGIKVGRVLDKLLDNALKFTPAGGAARLSVLPWQGGEVVLAVEDTGPGIPPAVRERAFQRFEQGGDIMTEKPKGTGLGLPIARAIIERHGGRLWLDPSAAAGCRILFTLPPFAEAPPR